MLVMDKGHLLNINVKNVQELEFNTTKLKNRLKYQKVLITI